MKTSLLSLGSMVLISSVAFAQVATTNSPSSTMQQPTPGLAATDSEFMKKLAQGGMAEVDAGRLATEKGTEARVRNFAQQMVTDHAQNNEQLRALAKSLDVELPGPADPVHRIETTRLSSEEGSRFDADYIKAQVEDHEKVARLLQSEIDSGQNSSVRQFAQKTLPVVKHHLEMAKQLQAGLVASRGS